MAEPHLCTPPLWGEVQGPASAGTQAWQEAEPAWETTGQVPSALFCLVGASAVRISVGDRPCRASDSFGPSVLPRPRLQDKPLSLAGGEAELEPHSGEFRGLSYAILRIRSHFPSLPRLP